MSSIIVTESGPDTMNLSDAPLIRSVLAKVWHPNTMLCTPAAETGAPALARDCWEHWGGETFADADRYTVNNKVRGVIVFSTDGHVDELASLADLLGIPVWRI